MILRAAAAVFLKDLRTEWRTRVALNALLLFAFSALVLGGYAVGRLWIEALRIDPANQIAGLRVNEWMSLLAIAISAIVLWRGRVGDDEASAPESVDQPA